MPTVKIHPLAEKLSKLLLGIETVPAQEQRKMTNRAINHAVHYCQDLEKKLNEKDDEIPCDRCQHDKSRNNGVFPEICGECCHWYSDNFQPVDTWECWNCGEYTSNERDNCHNCGEKRGEE